MLEQTPQYVRILVVEDSLSISLALKRKIEEDLGFEVLTAANMAQAEDIMSNETGISLAVLDLSLPDAMSGEVVDAARARSIPSIVFTGTLNEDLREEITAKGVIDYVLKGEHTISDLVAMIGRLHKNRNVKVLVVDDSDTFREYICSLLKSQMYRTHRASNGATALRILERNPDISLVVTDYVMPDMDGVELTQAIRKNHSSQDLAVIGVSSRSDKPLSAWFLKNGANDFLHKPFAAEEFHCRVAQNVETLERVKRLRNLSDLKNKFLGMAAHDLRNPINGIKGFTQLILMGEFGDLNPEMSEVINMVHKSSDHMLHLVNDLLDVTVIEANKITVAASTHDLDQLIRDRVGISRMIAARKSITVTYKSPGPLKVPLDANSMAQVLDNLISNAVKFSPAGSEVVVGLAREGDMAVATVRDHGPGLTEKDKSKLFQEFQRLSAQPTGGESSTGLGLAIVRKIVEAHKGKVWVEDPKKGGAAFRFSLPLGGERALA